MSFAPQPGSLLDGRYRLEQPLGVWALGETWRATDLRVSSRTVEVRITRILGGWDPIALSQLDREADALMRSPRGLIDRGQVDSVMYLVTSLEAPSLPQTRELSQTALPPTSFQPMMAAPPPPGGPVPAAESPFAPRGGGPVPAASSPFAPIPAPGSPYAPNAFAPSPNYARQAPQASRFVGAAVIGVLVVLIAAALAVKVVLKRSHGGPLGGSNTAGLVAPGPLPQIDATRIPVGTSPVLGSNSALITIVEFSDFECPFCGRAETAIAMLRSRYGDDLRVVWKNNPLPFHSHAQLAAEAALAAGAQGRFWPMHDLLFTNRMSLTRPDLERYAVQLGLDLPRFNHDLDFHTFAPQIAMDQALAASLGARGTPAFFINGTLLSGAQPVEAFTAIIDPMLVRARAIAPPNTVYVTMTDTAPLAPPPPAPPPAPSPSRGTLDPAALYYVPVTGAQPVQGPSDALVTVVVFSDFQCPFCARVEPTLAEVRRRYGGDVRIVWRHHPLAFHTHAMPAAEAAAEVFAQQGSGGFFRYHDTLFANQSALERADLERYAAAQGVNMARFNDALDRHIHQPAIDADAALATSLGANGTPNFFINGHPLTGAQPIDRFADAIDNARSAALSALGTGTPRSQLYNRTIAAGSTSAVYLPTAPSTPTAPLPAAPGAHTVYSIPPNPRAPSLGSPRAPVVIELFSDFQCPFCSRLLPTIRTIESTYAGRVRIVWRNYPLPFHNNAQLAAEAALEVYAQQGNAGFWRYHDMLFANQRALSRTDLESYAGAQGIDITRFRRALDLHTHGSEVRADMAAITTSGASIGTPSSFINGELLSGAVPFSEFQRVIDRYMP